MKVFVPITCLLLFTYGCSATDDRVLTRPDGGSSDDASLVDSDVATGEDVENGGDDAANPPVDADEVADEGNPIDSAPDKDDVTADMSSSGVCRPNRDGTITRQEVPFTVGVSAKFMVAEEVTFDTAGTMEAGTRTWDLAQQFDGEYLELIELRDPAGQWFETSFPGATYFTPLSATSDLLGVFEVTDDALLLLGVVSPDDGFFRTELEYDPAIPVLQFPLTEGESWSVASEVSGQFDGTITVYDEVYDFDVDAEGVLQTAFGNFQVLRVRSTLDRQVGFVDTVVRSFAFVTECFGTVATISSQENEDEIEFTDVAELKRIAP